MHSSFAAEMRPGAGRYARTCAIALLAWLLLTLPTWPVELRLQSPAAGATVQGQVNFAVEATEMDGIHTVEYLINGRTLSRRIADAPFAYAWNSWFFWDGWQLVQAIARSADGQEIARTEETPIRIDNHGFAVSSLTIRQEEGEAVEVTLPAKAVPVSGTIEVRGIAESRRLELPAGKVTLIWHLGQQQSRGGRFDTRLLANGLHILRAVAVDEVTRENGNATNQLFGSIQIPLLVQNTDAPVLPRLRWAQLVLAPGKRMAAGAAGVLSSRNPEIAAVDAAGHVAAGRGGATVLELDHGGRKLLVPVYVEEPDHGFPHFAKGGGMRRVYDREASYFPRSCFYLGAHAIEREPELLKHVREAGITALEEGTYVNPSHFVENGGIEKWRRDVLEHRWKKALHFAEEKDFHIVAIGDEIARMKHYLQGFYEIPWSQQALGEFAEALAASRRVVAIEMVDEASMVLGLSPSASNPRWEQLGVRPTLMADMMAVLRKPEHHALVGWPVFGLHGAEVAGAWTAPEVADYLSLYWTWRGWVRDPFGFALHETRHEIDEATIGRYPAMQLDRPLMLDYSVCGPWYHKVGDGPIDPERGDRIANNASSPQGGHPEWVAMQIGAMIARGAAGLRAYSFHWHGWQQQEVKSGRPQYGAHPFGTGSERWVAMAAAYAAIETAEAAILQPRASAIFTHPEVMMAARRGSEHALLMAVGFNEEPVRIQPDLSAWRLAGQGIRRIQVHGGNLSIVWLDAETTTDDLMLQPRETVYWITEKAVVPSIAFSTRDVRASRETVLRVALSGEVSEARFHVGAEEIGVAREAPFQVVWKPETAVHRDVWLSARAIVTDREGRVSEARTMVMAASAPHELP